MSKKPENIYDSERKMSLFRALQLLNNLGLLTMFIIIGCMIYIPYATSIANVLKPSPELVTTPVKFVEFTPVVKVLDGIEIESGLAFDKDLSLVKQTCTSCHSAKLITQNKATREGWQDMIIWMQKTQGLPDLGSSEPIILDYLAKYYAPEKIGRRRSLSQEEIEWYTLD